MTIARPKQAKLGVNFKVRIPPSPFNESSIINKLVLMYDQLTVPDCIDIQCIYMYISNVGIDRNDKTRLHLISASSRAVRKCEEQ